MPKPGGGQVYVPSHTLKLKRLPLDDLLPHRLECDVPSQGHVSEEVSKDHLLRRLKGLLYKHLNSYGWVRCLDGSWHGQALRGTVPTTL